MRSAREISMISTGRLEHGPGRTRRSAHTGIYMYTRVRADLLRALKERMFPLLSQEAKAYDGFLIT
jgi:hypothetical protein